MPKTTSYRLSSDFYTVALRLVLLLYFLLAWAIGIVYLDPDFGWHLRTGQYILSHGIPKTDPFSYTMPNFPFVDHAWLTDIALFVLNMQVGSAALAGAFALLTTFALWLQTPRR